MRATNELDRLILAVVGDDFTTLEFISDRLSTAVGVIRSELDAVNIRLRLLNLISDKLVNAYLLHAEPPYITPIDINEGSLSAGWFYITQRGRKCLQNSSGNCAGAGRRSVRPPDENEYTSALSF